MFECHLHEAENIQFIPIPKCAGTSIIAAMFGIEGTTEEIHQRKPQRVEWQPGIPTFAVIRHPLARLVSTWSNKVFAPHMESTNLIREHGFKKGQDFESFAVRVIEEGPFAFDRHLHPQVSFLPNAEVDLLKFEHLDQLWRVKGYARRFAPLLHLNRSRHGFLDITARQVDAIFRTYQEDFDLWRNLAV